jgi:membrane protein implicated in regulation of membrane protease activity
MLSLPSLHASNCFIDVAAADWRASFHLGSGVGGGLRKQGPWGRPEEEDSTMLIFTAIAVAAFILVAGSFLFGHDHDAGHDHDHGDGGDGGDASGGDATISIFSTKVVATLFMGFGAAGAIARSYQMSYLASSLIGLLSGVLLGAFMYAILSMFVRQQASSLVATSSAIGCAGTVTVSIGENSCGEVGLEVQGQYATYLARTPDGRAIAKGHTVRVVKTVGSQLVVEPETSATTKQP